jgi:nucleoside phosphorylase
MATTTRSLRHHDYTVAWVCAIPVEMAAAKAMLDEIHPDLPTTFNDQNSYVLGRIHAHNVVVACLPSGVYGTTSAATVANQMLSTFGSIRFGLMVGIGGGAPSKEADVRLGDVVVSKPTRDFGGVVQYDFGKTVVQGVFERTGMLNKPPQILLTAIARLQADQMMEPSRIPEFLSDMIATYPRMRAEFTYRGQEQDRLFDAASDHNGLENTCDTCEVNRLVTRPARDRHDPVIHYGLIASGNQVIQHGVTRDKLSQELGILCFEMEAAGLMDNFPCLVIRGISDYADSHKNKQWQEYAAAAAAAYAKELLSVIHPNQVEETPAIVDTNLQDNSQSILNG